MHKTDVFLHRYHLFRRLQWRWARGGKDLQPLPQGENRRTMKGALGAAHGAGCVSPAMPAGTKPRALRTVRGGGPGPTS
jgi:hypothetical protein